MLENKFVGLFDILAGMTIGDFLICLAVALVLGVVMALVYQFRTVCSRSFMITLASLPAIVSVVIMMVGGNLGTGVAVAGTFSLVRFRSMPGTAKEIGAIFLAVAAGIACGMGYPGLAATFAVIVSAFMLLLTAINFGGRKNDSLRKSLRITVPEDLDYTGVFDDIFEKYTTEHKLEGVKTTNLGSLNKLSYLITLRKADTEKAMIDELRCRNGNLEISISAQEMNPRDL